MRKWNFYPKLSQLSIAYRNEIPNHNNQFYIDANNYEKKGKVSSMVNVTLIMRFFVFCGDQQYNINQ